jgi:hypothetical protein
MTIATLALALLPLTAPPADPSETVAAFRTFLEAEGIVVDPSTVACSDTSVGTGTHIYCYGLRIPGGDVVVYTAPVGTSDFADDPVPDSAATPPTTEGDLITLDEGLHNRLLEEATTAALGDSVEIVPGLTVTVTAAAQTDPDPLDGYPLVAADIGYENRGDEDGMLAFSVVCNGSTAFSTGQFVEGPDDFNLEGVLPPGTTASGEIRVYLPSLWDDAETCDGPAWLLVSDAWSMGSAAWPITGDVVG